MLYMSKVTVPVRIFKDEVELLNSLDYSKIIDTNNIRISNRSDFISRAISEKLKELGIDTMYKALMKGFLTDSAANKMTDEDKKEEKNEKKGLFDF